MQRLSREELVEWAAFEEIYPFEDSWVQSARLVLAMEGDGNKTLGDIYPHLKTEKPKQTIQDMKDRLLRASAAFQAYEAQKGPKPK